MFLNELLLKPAWAPCANGGLELSPTFIDMTCKINGTDLAVYVSFQEVLQHTRQCSSFSSPAPFMIGAGVVKCNYHVG
jgi:hypothetical protein